MESHTRNFFQALEAHCASAVLTSIRVAQTCTHVFEETYFEDHSEMDYTISAFEPLLSFQNLRELDLFILAVQYPLEATALERGAPAWPHMRRFNLDLVDVDSAAEVETFITLDGLLPIAKHWPYLETISLSFNAELSINDVPLLEHGAGGCCPRLTVLDVGYSEVMSKTGVIAAFLTDIFLNLNRIDCSYDRKRWKRISKVVIVMRKVRKQERALAKRAVKFLSPSLVHNVKEKWAFLIASSLDSGR